MRIQIKLMDIFRDYVPPGSDASKFMLECSRNDRVDDIFFKLSIPRELPRIIVHNGQIADKDRMLTDGDVVAVFSPIFGG